MRLRCRLPRTSSPAVPVQRHSPLITPHRSSQCTSHTPRARHFHDYFVTLLPSSSQHPDSRVAGPSHKLPRDQSVPHDNTSGSDANRRPTSFHAPGRQAGGSSREMTTVRIPLRSAKHHFGAHCIRGTRPRNEDTYQAGTIEVPAFARRAPVSLTSDVKDGASAESASGDPQVFYFGVFDGHGGDNCSIFLRDSLHTYLETAAQEFGMQSTLQGWRERRRNDAVEEPETTEKQTDADEGGESGKGDELAAQIVADWKETVGGYFRRFRPEHFPESAGGKGQKLKPSVIRNDALEHDCNASPSDNDKSAIAEVLTYAFLRADLDFSMSQQTTQLTNEEDASGETIGRHAHHSDSTFYGGSTSSILLISTPSPTPFWSPSSPLSLMSAHLGDTRILLCSSATGEALPLTHDHHPDSPPEAARLRRYAGAFTTDSFGEERFATGLANTRSFGDARSKRMGVSAEPELNLVHLNPGEASFLVLVSDGVSGILSDQEIVDIAKEARTPDQAAKDIVSFAEELALGQNGNADNATALCIRLGGWERRNEGGNGSLGTREQRDWRRQEAADPRRGRTM